MKKVLDENVKVFIGLEDYATSISTRYHTITGDEFISKGGQDKGPAPFELLLGSLGSCTAITLKTYANSKNWDLQSVEVFLNMEQAGPEDGKNTIFTRQINMRGNLSTEQTQRLLNVAKNCPVAKLLTGRVEINTQLLQAMAL